MEWEWEVGSREMEQNPSSRVFVCWKPVFNTDWISVGPGSCSNYLLLPFLDVVHLPLYRKTLYCQLGPKQNGGRQKGGMHWLNSAAAWHSSFPFCTGPNLKMERELGMAMAAPPTQLLREQCYRYPRRMPCLAQTDWNPALELVVVVSITGRQVGEVLQNSYINAKEVL